MNFVSKIEEIKQGIENNLWDDGSSSDEFHNYDNKSRRLIHKWWREYSKTYLPEKLKATLPNSHDFSGVILRTPLPIEVPVEDYHDNKKED